MNFYTEEAETFFYDNLNDWVGMEVTSENLQKKMCEIKSYCPWDYIKKYLLFKNGKLNGNVNEITDKDYIKLVTDSFINKNVPYRYKTGKRDSQIVKQIQSFKTSKSTERYIALKWCLGLGMNASEAEEFLKKAFHQSGFDFRSPYECILYFVIKTNKSYEDANRLLKEYWKQMGESNQSEKKAEGRGTKYFSDSIREIEDEETLMNLLIELSRENESRKKQCLIKRKEAGEISEEGFKKEMEALRYVNLKEDFFDNINMKYRVYPSENEIDTFRGLVDEINEYLKELSRQNRELDAYYVDKDYTGKGQRTGNNTIENYISNFSIGQLDDASDYRMDIPFISVENWGDLISSKVVTVSAQDIKKIIKGNRCAERYEVILICFINFVLRIKLDIDRSENENRFEVFQQFVNKSLSKMRYQSYYLANPFECFLAMCVLSDDPEETFKYVVKYSKEQESIKDGDFPYKQNLQDFESYKAISEEYYNTLVEFSWLEKKYSLIFLGPSEIEKTHLAIGLGCRARKMGYKAHYTTMNLLLKCLINLEDKDNEKLMELLRDSELLVIDQVGSSQIDSEEGKLFIQLITELKGKVSLIIIAHQELENWEAFFGNQNFASEFLAGLANDRGKVSEIIFKEK